MNKFLLNEWTITIVGGVIVLLISYYIFGIGRKQDSFSNGGKGGDAKVSGNIL